MAKTIQEKIDNIKYVFKVFCPKKHGFDAYVYCDEVPEDRRCTTCAIVLTAEKLYECQE